MKKALKRILIIIAILAILAVALPYLLIVTVGMDAKTSMEEMHRCQFQHELEAMTDSFPAKVGIAFSMEGGEILEVNGNQEYPLLSVMKFPQALAVCQRLSETKITLSDTLHILSSELSRNTWSPMLERYTQGGVITIAQLLEYALVQSDNNASDLLFSHIADIDYTQHYLHLLLHEGCTITASEEMMRADLSRIHDNRATPRATMTLLEHLYQHHTDGEALQYVWEKMAQCQTGEKRIPRYISGEGDTVTGIIHKTGTGPVIEGVLMAVNDVGCILLPDSRHLCLAIFIEDAHCSMEQCEELIARIAKACVDFAVTGYSDK